MRRAHAREPCDGRELGSRKGEPPQSAAHLRRRKHAKHGHVDVPLHVSRMNSRSAMDPWPVRTGRAVVAGVVGFDGRRRLLIGIEPPETRAPRAGKPGGVGVSGEGVALPNVGLRDA